MIFVKNCTKKANIVHINKSKKELKFHSFKKRDYLSIFGKIEINRPYYWERGEGGVHPLDAKLNLPDCEYSYLLQEWGTCLASEQPYNKTINFLQKFLGIKFWDSILEQIVVDSCADITDFYLKQPMQNEDTESELLVATVDCKGVLMRKSELKKKDSLPKLMRLRKVGEKINSTPKNMQNNHEELDQKNEKKKMSCVAAVYTTNPSSLFKSRFPMKTGKIPRILNCKLFNISI